jgi:hypothetical protein
MIKFSTNIKVKSVTLRPLNFHHEKYMVKNEYIFNKCKLKRRHKKMSKL